MKKYFLSLVFLSLLLLISIDAIASKQVRVAILDNISDKALPGNYNASYINGITTAALAASNKGYELIYQKFFYNDDPLAILAEIPKVKKWQPDVIIGPHSSNQFLLLKNYFNDVLVISPYASDQSIESLPANFYSLSLSDKSVAEIIIKFITKNFPGKNIENIIAADCKDCVDLSTILSTQYMKVVPSAVVSQKLYIEDIDRIDIEKLMRGHNDNDLIILQPASYIASQQLIYRISNYLKTPPIFINDLDNWGNHEKIYKKLPVKFTEFWITPFLFNKNSNNFQQFSKFFIQAQKHPPQDAVSYMSFLSIMSVIEALDRYPLTQHISMRQKILICFGKAKELNHNWFKIKTYTIYKINDNGKEMIDTISAS